MFPMTMTISNAAQLQAVLAALNPEQIAQAAQVKTESPKKEATTAKKQEVAAPTQPTAEAVVADAPSNKAEDSAPTGDAKTADKQQTKTTEAASSEVTKEDAKTVALRLAKNKGRDALVALLSDFGAANLDGVKPEQFAEFVAKAKELGA
jgi:hypothetical protein